MAVTDERARILRCEFVLREVLTTSPLPTDVEVSTRRLLSDLADWRLDVICREFREVDRCRISGDAGEGGW